MFPEVQDASQFAKQVQSPCNNLDGNALPVSAFVPGGRVPLGTSQYEKRGIAINVPRVDMDKCTQCNKCSLICPHAAVRPFLASGQELAKAPAAFKAGSRAAIGGASWTTISTASRFPHGIALAASCVCAFALLMHWLWDLQRR